jgi:D-alanine transfer protein
MNLFLLTRILPLCISCVAGALLFKPISDFFFSAKDKKTTILSENYIYNFSIFGENVQNQFLINDTNRIFIFGSSELTSHSINVPQKFLNEKNKLPVLSIGHAGNQSFSMYCQLLAKNKSLKNSNLVVMVSPSWFFGEASKGTHSQVFFEYISDKFIQSIYTKHIPKDKKELFQYGKLGMNKHLKNVSNLSLEVKRVLNDDYHNEQITQTIGQKLCSPFYASAIAIKSKLSNKEKVDLKPIKCQKSKPIDWNHFENQALRDFSLISSNNTFGIDSNYYNQYVKGQTTTIDMVRKEDNQEFKDFVMLVKLLKSYKVNASFVVMPLNPYYYSNLIVIDPTIKDILNEIKTAKFPVLNLWVTKKSQYKKGMLNDIMHLGDYGWIKVNNYVYSKYKNE